MSPTCPFPRLAVRRLHEASLARPWRRVAAASRRAGACAWEAPLAKSKYWRASLTRPRQAAGPRDHRGHRSPLVFLMRSLACRSLRLDRDLVANILDIAVQEISHLLNG